MTLPDTLCAFAALAKTKTTAAIPIRFIPLPAPFKTFSLRKDACERFPRLRWELSDSMLEDFVTDEGWLKARKYRDSKRNGWTFEPLADSRKAWDQRYGPQAWNDGKGVG